MRLMKSHVNTIVRLGVGGLLLLLLFHMVDWRQTLPLFQTIRLGPFLLVIALYPLSLWISTLKWKSLLLPHGIEVPAYELFRHYWTGAFLNNFMPSSVGGDVGRVALLGRLGRPAEVAASVVVERLTGVFVLLVTGVASLALRPELFLDEWRPLLWFVASGGVLALSSIFLFGGYIVSHLPQIPAGDQSRLRWILGKAKKLVSSIVQYRDVPGILLKNIALSLVFYLLSVIGHYLSLQVFSLDVGFFDIFFIAAWISLITCVPVSFNGLGIAEGAFVVFYGMVGVLPPAALAVALLIRFAGLIISSIGGVFLLFPSGKTWSL